MSIAVSKQGAAVRLYLSSFKTGNCPERLVSLAGPGTRAALILNALDNFPHARKEWLSTQSAALASLGLLPYEVDLREYFGAADRLACALESAALLWINGGNAFLLRRAMRQSGFVSVIGGLLMSHRLVYAGFSAGACCAGPSLRGLEFVDDPQAAPEGYMSQTIWDGLGLVEQHIAVHYKSDHSESGAIEKTVSYYQQHNMPYIALRDGQAFVMDGEKTEIVG
jgi:dipeptidase E